MKKTVKMTVILIFIAIVLIISVLKLYETRSKMHIIGEQMEEEFRLGYFTGAPLYESSSLKDIRVAKIKKQNYVQLPYEKPVNVYTSNDLDVFFMKAGAHWFHTSQNAAQKVIISVPFRWDVYEVVIAKTELEDYLEVDLIEKTNMKDLYKIIEQIDENSEKKESLFSRYGRKY